MCAAVPPSLCISAGGLAGGPELGVRQHGCSAGVQQPSCLVGEHWRFGYASTIVFSVFLYRARKGRRSVRTVYTTSKCRRKAVGQAWRRRLCLRLGCFSRFVSSGGRHQGRGGKLQAGVVLKARCVAMAAACVSTPACVARCVDGRGVTALAQRDALSKRAWHVVLA